MFSALYNAVIEWNRNTSDRQKLQHAYLTIAVFLLILAGLVSLINSDSGQNLLRISAFAGAVFISNIVVWSLLESLVVTKLSNRRKR